MNKFLNKFIIITLSFTIAQVSLADGQQDCTTFINDGSAVHCTYTQGLGTDRFKGYWIKVSQENHTFFVCGNDNNSLSILRHSAADKPGKYQIDFAICQQENGNCPISKPDRFTISVDKNGNSMSNPAITQITFTIPTTFDTCHVEQQRQN
ncbi:MAG: hypothetical protein KIT27_11245 [Legionellales bacterium]|nr:hypothetical protein [Legionellales bacterium]